MRWTGTTGPRTAPPGPEPRTTPRWWTELLLVALVYAIYAAARTLAGGDEETAVENGLAILRFEQALGLNAEHPLNRLFQAEPWIGIPADFWYASLHYVVTLAVLVWIFRSRAVHYRAARTWLLVTTVVALAGFALLPTCPPRLLDASYGFVDTMAHYSAYGWWGGEASAPSALSGVTNQFAAMPSLHVGWALWCGVLLWRYGRSRATRAAGIAYPLITTVVVLGTANHYLLDAVAGALVLGVGVLLTGPLLRAFDRLVELLPARIRAGARPVAAGAPEPVAATVEADGAGESTIVGAGCKTSAGERILQQRTSAGTAAADDSTPAAAR